MSVVDENTIELLKRDYYGFSCKKSTSTNLSNSCIGVFFKNGVPNGFFPLLHSYRERSKHLAKKDKLNLALSLFHMSTTNKKRTSTGDIKFQHSWKLVVNHDNNDNIEIETCRECIEWVYGLGNGVFDIISKALKDNGLTSNPSLSATSREFNLNQAIRFDSKAEKKEIINNLPNELVSIGGKKIKPNSDGNVLLCLAVSTEKEIESNFNSWFDQYCKVTAEDHPESDIIYLTAKTKQDIYNVYKADMENSKTYESILSYNEFVAAWKRSYPNHQLRKFKKILGKCDDCELIESLYRRGLSYEDFKYAKMLHGMHRGGYYALSRKIYYDFIEEGRLNKSTHVTIDIDIMEALKVLIPGLGTQNSIGNTIKSSFIGVLEHHLGVHFYHFYDTMSKGANLVCYVILDILEQWKIRNNNQYPRRLFLNIDGGGENANETVLGLMEFLVSRRIVLEITFFRHPSGHTHGPLDGRFGNFKSLLAGDTIYTLDELKEKAEILYNMKGKVRMVFLTAIYDFTAYFRPLLDPQLARLHKSDVTQLVWKFEACDPSQYFPNGVKALYRAFAGDFAVEMKKYLGSHPLTKMTQITGIDVHVISVEWKPSPRDDPSRPSGGLYLLRDLKFARVEQLKLAAFKQKFSPEIFKKILTSVTKYFNSQSDRDRAVRSWWINFFENCAPKTNIVEDYAVSHPVHLPLAELFNLRTTIRRQHEVHQQFVAATALSEIKNIVDISMYGSSTASVEWSESNHTLRGSYLEPRHVVYASKEVRDEVCLFSDFSKIANAEGIKANRSKEEINSMFQRLCVLANQELVAYASINIPNTCKEIMKINQAFYSKFFKEFFNDNTVVKYKTILSDASKTNEIVASVDRTHISKGLVRYFSLHKTVEVAMDILVKMFNSRDTTILSEPRDISKRSKELEALGQSFFCSCSFLKDLDKVGAKLELDRFNFRKYNRILMPFVTDDKWMLLVLQSYRSNTFYMNVVDPQKGFTEGNICSTLLSLNDPNTIRQTCTSDNFEVISKYVTSLVVYLGIEQSVKLQLIYKKNNLLPLLEGTDHSGLLVICIMDFLYSGCNIFIKEKNLEFYKKYYAMALVEGQLPTYI